MAPRWRGSFAAAWQLCVAGIDVPSMGMVSSVGKVLLFCAHLLLSFAVVVAGYSTAVNACLRALGGLLGREPAAGCTGLSLGVSWYLPELAILSAAAAGFWWQVASAAGR